MKFFKTWIKKNLTFAKENRIIFDIKNMFPEYKIYYPMRVLILGGAGFIGINFLKLLLKTKNTKF